MTTICLSMIVKDEEHVIIECLHNLLCRLNINYIIICDTGSTDNTIEVIVNYLKDKNIQGEIIKSNWVDFAYNRNEALNYSKGKADYSMFFDADDLIVGNINLPTELKEDCYFFQIGTDCKYSRPFLVNNKKQFKWYGVLHEFLNWTPDCSVITHTGDYYIDSRRIGARNKNPDKYYNDAKIIEQEIEKMNNDNYLYGRYCYYCAQSYKDYYNLKKELNIKNKAIEYYNKTLNSNAWEQEKYVACLYLWYITYDLNSLLMSMNYDTERIECIVILLEYYFKTGNIYNANKIYYEYKNYKLHFLEYKLFIEQNYYNYNMEYIYSKYLLLNNNKNKFNLENGRMCSKKCIRNNNNVIECTEYLNKYNDLILTKCKNNKIIFYTGNNKINNPWNYSTLKNNSLGGSEQATIYLAIELCKLLNIDIIIFGGDIKSEYLVCYNASIEFINATIENRDSLQNYCWKNIIIIRYLDFFQVFPEIQFENLIVIQHDVVINYDNLLENNLHKIDYIINLTNWQKENTLKLYPILNDSIKVINNGINNSLFNCDDKIKNSFIYSSRPERGLKELLKMWESILNEFEDATLSICSYIDIPNDYLEIINELNKQRVSIKFFGKLTIKELYSILSKIEYFLYPTNFNETSCITAMEMMASGVICLYYPVGGLADTIGNYGIKVNKHNYLQTLINLTEENKKEIKQKGINYSKELSWENVAKEIIKLIN